MHARNVLQVSERTFSGMTQVLVRLTQFHQQLTPHQLLVRKRGIHLARRPLKDDDVCRNVEIPVATTQFTARVHNVCCVL